GEPHPARTALLITLAGSLGLASAERGVFKPVPSHARAWLERTRPQQVRALAEGWRRSTLYNDLWHTPGLEPEDTGWRNDPRVPGQDRAWRERTRPQQVRALAEGRRGRTLYHVRWHTPGLEPEDTGWRNDPLLARQTVLTFLEMVPPDDWWPVDEFNKLVKVD